MRTVPTGCNVPLDATAGREGWNVCSKQWSCCSILFLPESRKETGIFFDQFKMFIISQLRPG